MGYRCKSWNFSPIKIEIEFRVSISQLNSKLSSNFKINCEIGLQFCNQFWNWLLIWKSNPIPKIYNNVNHSRSLFCQRDLILLAHFFRKGRNALNIIKVGGPWEVDILCSCVSWCVRSQWGATETVCGPLPDQM